MQYIVSIVLLMILTLTTLKAETTSNLVSQDFTSGWSGTNIDTTHGSGVIAGVNNEYIESDSVSLNDSNVNKNSLNNGFEITGSSKIWFWNSNSQSVTQSIKVTDDNGNLTTQNRTISGTCATFNGCAYEDMTDTMIFGNNTVQDYDVVLRYDFSVPNTTGHYGADLKEPSLIVNYTYVPDINETVEQELINLFTDFEPEENIKIEEEFTFEIKEEPKIEEIFEVEESIQIVSMPEKELEIIEEKPEVMEETMIEEKPEEEVITEEIIKEAKEEMPKEIIEEKTEEVVAEKEEEIQEEEVIEETTEETPKKEIKTKVASKKSKKPKIDKIMAKVDEQVKDSAKNLVIKNIIKLDAMQNDQASLTAYNNVEFYKPKDIYLNQIEIFDNRSIYANVDLLKYTDNDIMEIKIKKLNEIKSKKRILLLELKELKND
jgi:hypothetical protein